MDHFIDHSANRETILVLKKSSVRRDVLKYLNKIFSESSYPAEMARHAGFSSTQIIGALGGLDGRYNPENSLITHGLVEVKLKRLKTQNISKVYILTSLY